MTFRIDMDDIDRMLTHGVLQPHAAIGAPTAPSIQQAQGAPGLPISTPAPPDLQKPTRKESNAAGRAEFEMGKPTVTAEPGLPGFYQQKEEQNQYAKEHPWGSPVSAHPGFLGKVGHGLATAGNIAADIFVPRVAENIPGTQLNREQQSAENEAGFERAEKGQQEQERTDSEKNLQSAQADAIRNPIPKEGLTPEETTIHDLMTGQDGKPRINPQTKQPYSYLEAYQSVKRAAQDVKPEPQPKTQTPEEQYDDAVKAGDQTRAKQILDEMHSTSGAKRGPKDTTVSDANRSDRSYQFHVAQIEKIRTPIDQINQRLGRLNDTLAQGNPQADALVAPELLSVMAGGQGSGVRMNDAEINRIVGGRSAWENLRAQIQHWNTDPKSARSITPEQDKQIRALVQAVQGKLTAKMSSIQQAQQQLVEADDPKEHRRIFSDLQKQLDDIDAGKQSSTSGSAIELERGPDGKLRIKGQK